MDHRPAGPLAGSPGRALVIGQRTGPPGMTIGHLLARADSVWSYGQRLKPI
jgi:hypothetical protein